MQVSQSSNSNHNPLPVLHNNNKQQILTLEARNAAVTYHPSAWGDYFLVYASNPTTESCSPDQAEVLQRRQKEEVKKLLATMTDDAAEKLDLIDAIQQLGLGYQFQTEISKTLEHIYNNKFSQHKSNVNEEVNDVGLRSHALCFRLLRQHGYNARSDGFNKFKNIDGKFEELLINDVEGLLSLYEAANFRVHGEDILEEAFEFCQTRLNEAIVQMTNISLAKQADEALKLPIHKTLTLLGVKKFMSWYQHDETHHKVLLNFAKAEFNKLQKMYQKELAEITQWWKELDFTNKLPFAKDRVVECYFWSLAFYFEPEYSFGRRLLCKVAAMTSTIDDIYDNYGTFDELRLFTNVVQRWDGSGIDELPPYMKFCYQALVDVYIEAKQELEKTGKSYCVQYAKQEMKKLVMTFFDEAKWLHKKQQTPNMKEYMKVAVASSGYMMAITTSLMGLGDSVSERDFDWATNEPLAIRAISTIARLMNDVAGYGFEQDVSAVQCYMNDNIVSEEETFGELGKQVTRAWMDINQACLIHSTQHEDVSMQIMTRVSNASKIIYLLYRNKDGYTNSNTDMKNLIRSVLVKPMDI